MFSITPFDSILRQSEIKEKKRFRFENGKLHCSYIYRSFLQASNHLDAQGGAVGGACVSFNGWAMKKRGPVLVAVFNPIGTVISVAFSVITLGDRFNLAR